MDAPAPQTSSASPGEPRFGKALRGEFLFAPSFRNLNHGVLALL